MKLSDRAACAGTVIEMCIRDRHVPILVKGGHLVHDEAADLLYDGHEVHWFSHTRLQNPNTHGTGCTLSSAIACNLANGLSLKDSVAQAKNYLTGAIRAGLSLGHGRGPLNHMYKDCLLYTSRCV